MQTVKLYSSSVFRATTAPARHLPLHSYPVSPSLTLAALTEQAGKADKSLCVKPFAKGGLIYICALLVIWEGAQEARPAKSTDGRVSHEQSTNGC